MLTQIELHESSLAAPHDAVGHVAQVAAHLAERREPKLPIVAHERLVLALVVADAEEMGAAASEWVILAAPADHGGANEKECD